jgi:hypothetical protein
MIWFVHRLLYRDVRVCRYLCPHLHHYMFRKKTCRTGNNPTLLQCVCHAYQLCVWQTCLCLCLPIYTNQVLSRPDQTVLCCRPKMYDQYRYARSKLDYTRRIAISRRELACSHKTCGILMVFPQDQQVLSACRNIGLCFKH